MTKLRVLLQDANNLRVDAIAQEPMCADFARQKPAEAYAQAREGLFDFLPIRET